MEDDRKPAKHNGGGGGGDVDPAPVAPSTTVPDAANALFNLSDSAATASAIRPSLASSGASAVKARWRCTAVPFAALSASNDRACAVKPSLRRPVACSTASA